MRLSEVTIVQTNEILRELFASLAFRSGPIGSSAVREIALDMRFVGQEHTLTVAPGTTDGQLTSTVGELRTLFAREYANAFEATMNGDVEIVSVRASVRRGLPRRRERVHAVTAVQAERRMQAFSFAEGKELEFALVDRLSIAPGMPRKGPLVITEPTTTTYVDSDFEVEVDSTGCLHLRHLGV